MKTSNFFFQFKVNIQDAHISSSKYVFKKKENIREPDLTTEFYYRNRFYADE